MGPHLELKEKEVRMEVLEGKENKSASFGAEDKLTKCASNCEDKMFDMGDIPDASEEVDINVTECTNDSCGGPIESKCQDVTENSSSFGDTLSGAENGSLLDGEEVESQLLGGNAFEPAYDGYSEAFRMRKKRLTDHWRMFIRPLMWRCKWTELRMKELQSQALKYHGELALHDKRKQIEYEKLEISDAKSLPLSSQFIRDKVMKRKKRKRVEEVSDVASYMSCHNLFSYYETKKSVAAGASVEDFRGNPDKTIMKHDELGMSEGWSFELKDGDKSLEQILSKIEVVQSQVQKLKNRIDKVMSENPKKFSSINRLSFIGPSDNRASPENGNISPVRSVYMASLHIPEDDFADIFLPESAVSNHEEVTLLHSITETLDKPRGEESVEFIRKENLMNNQTAKKELHVLKKARDKHGNISSNIPVEQTQVHVMMDEQRSAPPEEAAEADLTSKTSESNVQSKVKSPTATKSSFPINKRKRARRKRRSTR